MINSLTHVKQNFNKYSPFMCEQSPIDSVDFHNLPNSTNKEVFVSKLNFNVATCSKLAFFRTKKNRTHSLHFQQVI